MGCCLNLVLSVVWALRWSGSVSFFVLFGCNGADIMSGKLSGKSFVDYLKALTAEKYRTEAFKILTNLSFYKLTNDSRCGISSLSLNSVQLYFRSTFPHREQKIVLKKPCKDTPRQKKTFHKTCT